MDDKESRTQRFQRFIQLLKDMDEETRKEYLDECKFEERNPRNDGWVIEGYRDILEASKHV